MCGLGVLPEAVLCGVLGYQPHIHASSQLHHTAGLTLFGPIAESTCSPRLQGIISWHSYGMCCMQSVAVCLFTHSHPPPPFCPAPAVPCHLCSHIQPKGTKAEMALRVLGVFGLKAATAVPVQLLRVVGLERSPRLAWDGPDASDLHERVNTAVSQLVGADKETWQHLMTARVRAVCCAVLCGVLCCHTCQSECGCRSMVWCCGVLFGMVCVGVWCVLWC